MAQNVNYKLKEIADGYFKFAGTIPLKTFNAADVTRIRDYAVYLLYNLRKSDFNFFINQVAKAYGVDPNKAIAYIKKNPSFVKTISSDENLESGDIGEALKNSMETVFVKPFKAAGSLLGQAAGGFITNTLKGLLPVILLAVVVFAVIFYLSKQKK